jgi:hypothetical protein
MALPNTALKADRGELMVGKLLPRLNMVLPPLAVASAPSSSDGIDDVTPPATSLSAMN